MDKNQPMTTESIEQQLNEQLHSSAMEEEKKEIGNLHDVDKKEKPSPNEKDTRVLSVGEWMITILFYLIPIVNIVMIAIWSFSSKGNGNRRNLSRACLLWLIILLIAYVVAMTIAGFTILDIFKGA